MKITVKNIKGESFTLDVHQSETVKQNVYFFDLNLFIFQIRDIKNKIKTLKNVDPETQKLILKGQIVLDEKKAEDYNIKEGDLLVLMVTKVKKLLKIFLFLIRKPQTPSQKKKSKFKI